MLLKLLIQNWRILYVVCKQNQRAWLTKRKEDIAKLELGIDELEHLDIEMNLDRHEKLSNWTEHNNAILALKKELSTLEPALVRADKSVEKANKDIADLDDATCYTCGQELHARQKAEIADVKTKNLKMLYHIKQRLI